jgi:hypothetical protein
VTKVNIIMGLFKDCGCGCNGQKQQEKFVTSLISGLTFFIIANPETFRLVRRVLGPRIATPNGCPSTMGLLVHSLVFILVVWGMMNVKSDAPPLPIVEEEEDDAYIVQPKRMVDIVPEPGMEEPGLMDSGVVLGSLDITGPSL